MDYQAYLSRNGKGNGDIALDKGIAVLERIAFYAVAKPWIISAVLYYADRLHAAYTGRTLYGDIYLAYHHAAVPKWANHAYMTLKLPERDMDLYFALRKHFKLDYDGWLVNMDMTAKGDRALSPFERNCLDDAMYWLASASAKEVIAARRDKSWRDTPWGKAISSDDMTRNGIETIDVDSGIQVPRGKPLQLSGEGVWVGRDAFDHNFIEHFEQPKFGKNEKQLAKR